MYSKLTKHAKLCDIIYDPLFPILLLLWKKLYLKIKIIFYYNKLSFNEVKYLEFSKSWEIFLQPPLPMSLYLI
jgi:hypothetical protein